MGESLFLDISGDGIAAGHPQRVSRPKPVAPSTGEEFNTIQPQLITVGCAQVPDHQFEFDSSVIMPSADKCFRKLIRLVKAKPGCPLSVFGHADSVGRDAYNKRLSGRRALAVYAVLIRDPDLWEDKLYKKPAGGDRWGTRSIQIFLNAVGYPPGPINGEMNKETRDAVEAFQSAHDDLTVDRDPGPKTRRRLFEVYMDMLCTDGRGQPYKVEKTDFIARGSDPDGKGDYQGCGEFNPVLLFSQQEQDEFEKEENQDARNEANAPNRRVLVYLFKKGIHVDPDRWPCPRAKEDGQRCRERFWSDGETRRSTLLPDARREFEDTEDTFSCRFYHGLAAYSPCEAALKLWVLRLQVDGPEGKRIALAGRRFAVIAGTTATAPTLRGTTDDRGILRIPVYDEVVTMTLKLDVSGYLFDQKDDDQSGDDSSDGDAAGEESQPGGGGETDAAPEGAWEGEEQFRQFTLKCGSLLPVTAPGYDPFKQRLYNLGHGKGDPGTWNHEATRAAIKAFQRRHGLEETGDLPHEIRDKIQQEHGS